MPLVKSSDRVFGAYRRELFTETPDQPDADAQSGRETRVVCLRRAITETKSKRLIRTLNTVDNPDQSFIRDLNERLAEIGEGNLTAATLTERIHTWIAPPGSVLHGCCRRSEGRHQHR